MRNRRRQVGFGVISVVVFMLVEAMSSASAQIPASQNIPVDSPAFVFSPGNWSGDQGRAGGLYRQSWNSGAYFRFTWSTTMPQPTATLNLDTSALGDDFSSPPQISYNVDGVWTASVPCNANIPISGISGPGTHTLTVYFEDSQQKDRWGLPGSKGLNALRVGGITIDSSAHPVSGPVSPKWILEIGDSITEGIMADNGGSDNLADYSYFVGEGLQQLGYEYCVSACGCSGWLRPGDFTGDVPGYYIVSNSSDGKAGQYDPSSRWDKINFSTSVLDSVGHISAYGKLHQEPSIITLNYGTNDAGARTNPSDTVASISESITSLRKAAPLAKIFLIIPFGQFDSDLIEKSVLQYRTTHPRDKSVLLIDLGPSVAHALAAGNYVGGLHPNMRGHAAYATAILANIVANL